MIHTQAGLFLKIIFFKCGHWTKQVNIDLKVGEEEEAGAGCYPGGKTCCMFPFLLLCLHLHAILHNAQQPLLAFKNCVCVCEYLSLFWLHAEWSSPYTAALSAIYIIQDKAPLLSISPHSDSDPHSYPPHQSRHLTSLYRVCVLVLLGVCMYVGLHNSILL